MLQTNEKATTVLIIVNNSTFIFLFWLILVVINELRIFFTARILSINVFRLYEQQTKMNISSYTEKFDAPIRRVIKVYKRLSFVVYMYICVCASFFFPQLKVRTSLARWIPRNNGKQQSYLNDDIFYKKISEVKIIKQSSSLQKSLTFSTLLTLNPRK